MAVDVPEDRMMLPDSGCLYKRQEQSLQKMSFFGKLWGLNLLVPKGVE